MLEPVVDPILDGSVSAAEAVATARRHLEEPEPDHRWCIPWSFVLWQQGDYEGAYQVASARRTILQDNDDFLLLYGMIARQLPNRLDEAEAAFQSAIRLSPDRHDTYYNLGNLYYAQDRFEDAIEQYRRSISINPSFALSWLNLGLSARSVDKLALSKVALQRAIVLDPKSIRCWCNYGITCHQLESFSMAIESYSLALSLAPDDSATLVNLAQALNASNRHPEAIKYLQAASSLTLQEDCGDALFNLALTRLLLGDYVRGWELYECRFKTRQHDAYTRVPRGEWIQCPRRLRELASEGAEVLVWSEQGLGDAIQFVRYLHLLKAIGLRPVLATRPLLVRLFNEWLSPSFPVIDDVQVDLKADQRPHIAMLSLPHLFGSKLETIPSALPYLCPPGPPPEGLLVPPPHGGLSVGLVWASNPDNKLMYRRKSLPLPSIIEPLLPALREDLLELHCLQVGQDAEALKSYADYSNIVDWNGRLGDFADTAHVVSQLDLVISVDTGVAHLAGALGVPTWLMLHYDADFRWLRNCESSPWYPNMKLFRQASYGDWSSVTHSILAEIGFVYGLDLLSLV